MDRPALSPEQTRQIRLIASSHKLKFLGFVWGGLAIQDRWTFFVLCPVEQAVMFGIEMAEEFGRPVDLVELRSLPWYHGVHFDMTWIGKVPPACIGAPPGSILEREGERLSLDSVPYIYPDPNPKTPILKMRHISRPLGGFLL